MRKKIDQKASTSNRNASERIRVFGDRPRFPGPVNCGPSPVVPLHDGNYLAVDFAAHRTGFVLNRFSDTDMAELHYRHPVVEPPTGMPDHNVVMKLIAREFPGFLGRQ